jgi:hypothetical protein
MMTAAVAILELRLASTRPYRRRDQLAELFVSAAESAAAALEGEQRLKIFRFAEVRP